MREFFNTMISKELLCIQMSSKFPEKIVNDEFETIVDTFIKEIKIQMNSNISNSSSSLIKNILHVRYFSKPCTCINLFNLRNQPIV